MPDRANRLRLISRILLASFFIAAGILHFVFPVYYARIIPPILSAPLTLVAISGVCEILGGLGVLIPHVRRLAGYGLIALLIAVFPANIYMASQQVQTHGWTPFTFLTLLRLPLQFLFIAWVCHAALAETV